MKSSHPNLSDPTRSLSFTFRTWADDAGSLRLKFSSILCDTLRSLNDRISEKSSGGTYPDFSPLFRTCPASPLGIARKTRCVYADIWGGLSTRGKCRSCCQRMHFPVQGSLNPLALAPIWEYRRREADSGRPARATPSSFLPIWEYRPRAADSGRSARATPSSFLP